MRRFFTVLFILSVGATAAALYWRTYLPEGGAPVVRSAPAPSATRSARPSAEGPDASRPPSYAPSGEKAASDRQDWALTVSIVSSVISALAALVQTWLTARAMPPARRVGD
jgi:hypothetical protein